MQSCCVQVHRCSVTALHSSFLRRSSFARDSSSAAALHEPGPGPLAGCAAPGSRWSGRPDGRGGRAPPHYWSLFLADCALRRSRPGRHGLAVWGVIREANTEILSPSEF